MAKPEFDNPDDEIIFNIINPDVIDKLKNDKKIMTPTLRQIEDGKRVDVSKDKQWNQRTITSRIMQGLQNGDNIQTISNSLFRIVGKNESSAIRNARTMVTSAENGGRLDSYKSLSSQGVVMKKIWEATADDRTRPSHIDIDGEEKDIEEKFSNGCQYPGDGNGPAEEVWQCRCAMGTHIIGFKRADGSISYVDYTPDRTIHEEQMDEERQRRGEEQKDETSKPTSGVVNGTDILSTWHRREDQFDFSIEDVINAQGFDGLPRVVDADEFDKCVEESNFIAQRTYSAPDQETLDAYRDQLYNGQWYVDCSTGGSVYGQGMYVSSSYDGKITNEIKEDMATYSSYARNHEKPYYIETMTLDPSARIITERELEKLIDTLSDEGKLPMSDGDVNDIAVLLGYDAVRVNLDRYGTHTYTIVLNRTKLIIKEP